jgi:hypothetical protein
MSRVETIDLIVRRQIVMPSVFTESVNETAAESFNSTNLYDAGRWLYFLLGVFELAVILFAYSQISSIRKPVSSAHDDEHSDLQNTRKHRNPATDEKHRRRKSVPTSPKGGDCELLEISSVAAREVLPAVIEKDEKSSNTSDD